MVERKQAIKAERISDYGKRLTIQNASKVNVQNKINTVMFKTDHSSHITLDPAACASCKERPCLTVCPAGMFSLSGDGSEVIYSHEGCLECGTCYVVCPALSWEYPRAGYGVIYRES